jgi:hypothetical protein
MNKKLLLALTIFAFVVYEYVINIDDDEEDEDDKEPSTKDKIYDFLKMMGIMLGTDLFFKGLAKGIKRGIASRTASNLAKKEAQKFAEQEAERLALLEEERLARTEAERLARAEAERLAQKEAERLAQKEAERLAQTEAEKLAMTEAERLAEIEAEKLAQKEAEKGIAEALAKAEAQRIAQAEADKLAETEAERLATEETERIARVEAERLAKIEAQKILEETAQKELLKLTEEELAKKGLAKVGETVVLKTAEKEAGKLAGMMAKLAGGPFEWISFALSTALYAGLGLDSSMFTECPDDEWSFTHLPSEVLMVLNAIPFFGDAWQLIGELVCFKVGKCPEGKELSIGSCYTPCKDGFKSDTATMCYKQYEGFENRGFPTAPTITSITLDVRSILGHMPDSCPEGQELQGGLCRTACKNGYDPVLDRCYAHIDTVGNGVGNVLKERPCGSDEREDGTVCWKKSGEVCADDCSKGWDSCKHQSWNALKCKRGSNKGSWGCYRDNPFVGPCDGNQKQTWTCDEYGDYDCIGGCPTSCAPVYLGARTELDQRLYCDDPNQERIGSLCYDKCPPGKEKVPGFPNQCRTIGEVSYERGFGDMPTCGPGTTEFQGLCYYLSPGFEIKSAGLETEPCPPGSQYFGVGCTREAYNRGVGHIAFDMHMKKRDNYYGHKDAGDGFVPDIGGLIDRRPK